EESGGVEKGAHVAEIGSCGKLDSRRLSTATACHARLWNGRLLKQHLLGAGRLQEAVDVVRVIELQNVANVGEVPSSGVSGILHQANRGVGRKQMRSGFARATFAHPLCSITGKLRCSAHGDYDGR